jgi:hypothetical protein
MLVQGRAIIASSTLARLRSHSRIECDDATATPGTTQSRREDGYLATIAWLERTIATHFFQKKLSERPS